MIAAPKTQRLEEHGIYSVTTSEPGRRFRESLSRELLSLGRGADPVKVAHRAHFVGATRTAFRRVLLAEVGSILWDPMDGEAGIMLADSERVAANIAASLAAFSWLERHSSN